MITDNYGRTFKTLRISLLSSCNLACVYCTEEDDISQKHLKDPGLNVSQLLQTVKELHQVLNLESVRLTGGEPLLYPDLEQLIAGLKDIGIPAIKMTTNGFLLQNKAAKLKATGLQEINVSLDAAEEGVFFLMTKRAKFQEVSDGIDTAINAGLHIKINSVIMKNKNHNQIIPLLDYAFSRYVPIRFLEVMAMGHLHNKANDYLFGQRDILDTIAEKYAYSQLPRKKSSTANYWETTEGHLFGIIANHSEPFCADCNRLRLDHKGNIYGCLSSNSPLPLAGLDTQGQFKNQLISALKQKKHTQFTGSNLSMLAIGG